MADKSGLYVLKSSIIVENTSRKTYKKILMNIKIKEKTNVLLVNAIHLLLILQHQVFLIHHKDIFQY